MTMADTVAVMNHGQVEQMGPPQELYELPRTAFVANFLGKSNLMPAVVTGNAGQYLQIDVAGNSLTLLKDRATDHTGKILVGIRPEKLRMEADTAAAAPGSIRGVVLDASFTGASTEYLVDAEGIGTVGVFAQNHGGALFHDGDRVRLAWDPEHAFGLSGSEDREAGAGEDGL